MTRLVRFKHGCGRNSIQICTAQPEIWASWESHVLTISRGVGDPGRLQKQQHRNRSIQPQQMVDTQPPSTHLSTVFVDTGPSPTKRRHATDRTARCRPNKPLSTASSGGSQKGAARPPARATRRVLGSSLKDKAAAKSTNPPAQISIREKKRAPSVKIATIAPAKTVKSRVRPNTPCPTRKMRNASTP